MTSTHNRSSLGPLGSLARSLTTNAVLAITAAVGGLLVLGLTSASAGVYDAVTEKDGIAGFDQPVLDQAIAWRTPLADHLSPGSPTWAADRHDDHRRRHHARDGVAVAVRTPLILMVIAVAGSLAFTNVGKAIVGRTGRR